MLQRAAAVRNPRRQQIATTRSISSPTGGWNDRDSLAAMPENDAVILDNFWPLPSKVVLRNGFTNWATGITGQVESLMGYVPQTGTPKLFAAAGTKIYDATASGAIGAAVVSSLTNARWQHANIGTAGGNFLLAVNGADKLRGWNGTAWWADGDGTHDITGVDTATWTQLNVAKHRVWAVQKATAKAWYLPIDAIAGAAASLDFGSQFAAGGYLVDIANWTLDGGNGPDDYTAFIGSNGDIAIYRGTDPASATTWALVGMFNVGAPIGTRCAAQYRGDVVILCQDGVYPLSQVLTMNRTNTAVAYTDKIQHTMSTSATLFGSTFGWQVIPFPGQNMLVLNVPVAIGTQQQYVMNTITGAWARFKGWPANCFEVFNSELYYGGNGVVCKAWNGRSDGGVNINGEALQAFSYFGARDALKDWGLIRPLLAFSLRSGLFFGINTDFDQTAPPGIPTPSVASTAAQWGSGKWRTGKWGGTPAIQKGWQSVSATGYCAAAHILCASMSGHIEWYATDYAFSAGGIM